MKQFDYMEKWKKLLTPQIVSYLTTIHEYKGKQHLIAERHADVLENLVEIAKIQSTESSNKIEGIYTSDERLKKIVLDKTMPKTRNEREIADIQAGKQDDAVNKLDWQAQKAEQARIRKIENSLKKIEDEIAALEEEISAIDEECAKPENAVNSAKLNELAARQQECRERLETCYETWEDLSMQLDGAKDS